ncbi:MAG: hypothetical protein P8104_03330 [Gammaproteobacteria bacterium]
MLSAVQVNPNIKSVIIINLKEQGDPIYAGISDQELILASPTLLIQMFSKTGKGHFYYTLENNEGQLRRQNLATQLFQKGLR